MQIVKRTAFVTAVLVGCVAAASLATAAGEKDAEAAIRAGTAGWIAAYNAGDADAIVPLYTEDAVVMAPGAAVANGQSAIRQFLVKDIAGSRANGVTLVLGSTHDVGVSGDLAWDSGNYSVRDKSGATIDTGSYLAVWRKTGDKWKCIRDMWNSDRAPAPSSK